MKPKHLDDRKLILTDHKSVLSAEVVFLSQKVADRLKEYVRAKVIEPDQRTFRITYAAVKAIVK